MVCYLRRRKTRVRDSLNNIMDPLAFPRFNNMELDILQ